MSNPSYRDCLPYYEKSAVVEKTENFEFQLDPTRIYVAHVSGDGVLEFWDGVAYVAYVESSEGFQFRAPASGLVRLVVTSGTVKLSLNKAVAP